MEHLILLFNEINEVSNAVFRFRVSTRKIEQFKAEHDFEYGYVEELIDDALKGKTTLLTSRKYSFGDSPSWYEGLKPDADCTDKMVSIDVYL